MNFLDAINIVNKEGKIGKITEPDSYYKKEEGALIKYTINADGVSIKDANQQIIFDDVQKDEWEERK